MTALPTPESFSQREMHTARRLWIRELSMKSEHGSGNCRLLQFAVTYRVRNTHESVTLALSLGLGRLMGMIRLELCGGG